MERGQPLWRQRWHDLAFFHWPVDAKVLEQWVPEGVRLDLHDGCAWVSVVPFRMEDVMLRSLPAIPGVSAFPELNLRTYVERDGKPGVWFFSLDADQRLAVWAARRFFHLPYFKADMRCQETEDGGIRYRSKREFDGAMFEATYRGIEGSKVELCSGGLEYWLTERYCLYAADADGRLYRGEVHHQQWPLQEVDYHITVNHLGDRWGIPLEGEPHYAQFSRELEVAVWPLQPL
ncbi:YqjF family protein [Rubritalea tangerina]